MSYIQYNTLSDIVKGYYLRRANDGETKGIKSSNSGISDAYNGIRQYSTTG